MTIWHHILIGGCGLIVLALIAVKWLAPRLPPDTPDDTTHAPEAEADTRFVTKVRRGTYHTHIF